MLEFLAAQRFVVAPQVQALLGCSARTAREQLRLLALAGHAERAPIFAGRPSTWQINAAGLRAVGSSLSAPRLQLSSYEHDLGLGWLWLAARNGALGELTSVRSERELRSADLGEQSDRDAVEITPDQRYSTGTDRRHHPDLILETRSQRRIAVELELTPKSRARMRSIMLSFAASPRIDAVLYLVSERQHARSVATDARAAGIGSIVHVQPIRLPIHGAPRFTAPARPASPGAAVGQRA